MSPVLTKQSLLEAPNIGRNTAKAPTSQRDMFTAFHFVALDVPDVMPSPSDNPLYVLFWNNLNNTSIFLAEISASR